MPQVITIPKLNNQLENLQKELKNLRSFVIGIAGKDKEGQYKPSFIKKILRAGSKEANYVFEDEKSFIGHIRNHD